MSVLNTPWKLTINPDGAVDGIEDSNGRYVSFGIGADSAEEHAANMDKLADRELVRVVNSHDKLVQFLRDLKEEIERGSRNDEYFTIMQPEYYYSDIDALLAEATGGQDAQAPAGS